MNLKGNAQKMHNSEIKAETIGWEDKKRIKWEKGHPLIGKSD